MDIRNFRTAAIMLTLITLVSACNMPSVNAQSEDAPAEASQDAGVAQPAEIAFQHELIPIDLPAERSSHAGDYDSSKFASKKMTAGGDRFTFGRFERPFNANTMDAYFSQLDIVDTFVFQDESWIYGTITIKSPDASNALAGKYALELDLDRDGKGDWLIIASNPASTEWSVNGVQAFEDANNDVGDQSPMYADENASGDGFETRVFDQGNGNDPDTAWVRISPTNPNTVEIAIKRSALGDPEKYLINMWAGTSLLDPALFDLNDHFTHEQAGAADPGYEYFYPIKEVAEIDNSCRMAVGFEPTGSEPGLCEIFIPHVPGEPPPPGAPKCPSTCPYGQDPYPSCMCWPG